MKEFIDKLITRIMLESASCKVYKLINPNIEDITEFNAYKKCIEIINELAEEYNGNLSETLTGWIPCERELPEDRKEKLVYLSSNRITIARYNDHRLPYSDYPIGWGFPAPYFYIDFEKETVVAWMPLPAPFKEGE